MRYVCPYCTKPMPSGMEVSQYVCCSEIGHCVPNEAIKALLRMLREASHAIAQELNSVGDYRDHPMLKEKSEMLDRHEKALKKMGLI